MAQLKPDRSLYLCCPMPAGYPFLLRSGPIETAIFNPRQGKYGPYPFLLRSGPIETNGFAPSGRRPGSGYPFLLRSGPIETR